MVCTRNGSYYKWYHSDGHTLTYIPKKERNLAEQLAKKKYLTLLLEDTLQEKRAIELYQKRNCNNVSKSEQLLLNPPYQELLSPYFKPHAEELSDWMHSYYESNEKYPEQRIHKTPSGHTVRSKSEALIAVALNKYNLPFRYECALTLDNTTFYPDFTILHPVTGEIFYWEHFGRMDDPSYRRNAISKLDIYSAHGIIPTIQLITTFETKEQPLNADFIEKIVQYHFI